MFNIEDELKKVPNYSRFYTLDEMLAKAHSVADEHPEIFKYEIVGSSSDGEPISMLTAGTGEKRILLFASPHPNEPIGGMLIQFLLDELIQNEALRTAYTWYLLPCVDPDGTRLNEGWFAGPYTVQNYARHFYRPPSAEQVEWTFPVHYKDLHFHTPMPETKALMNAFDIARPSVVYSLHNAGFGGVYYYLSHDLKDVYGAFSDIPKSRGLAMSLGEAEMPWAKEFSPAVYQMSSITEAYDYLEQYGDASPEEIIQGGGSSADYLRDMARDGKLAQDPLILVTELPYFQTEQIADQTLTEKSRREVILAGIQQAKESALTVKAILERIAPEMTLDSRFYRAVRLFNQQTLDGLPSRKKWVREAADMEQAATVAQTTDELYVGSFYRLLVTSMLRRALDAQLAEAKSAGLESSRLESARAELEALLETWTNYLEEGLEYEAIPIKKLVDVQYGALLAVLDSSHLQKGHV